MRALLALLFLSGLAFSVAGCGAGEQEAPKPNPAQFTPKPGGPESTP